MRPIVHGLEAEYAGQIQFTYLDMDDPATDDLKRQLGFQWRPHFFLLDGAGNVVRQWVGFTEEAELRSALDAVLQ
jgi:thioredoxin-like negative regulator of GroEL